MTSRKNSGKKNILSRLKKERGYLPAEWAYLAERDPEFMDAYNGLYEKAMTDGKALSAKTKELITIGLLAYRGFEQGVLNHAKRALRLGATMEELVEAVETVIIAGGSPALRTGLMGLMMMEEEQKEK